MCRLRRPFQIFTLVLCAALSACTNPTAREQGDARLAKARLMFQERCQRAGERILRTVLDVEGVLLLKVRSERKNFYGQFEMSDPYGNDMGGNGYIESFLKDSYRYDSGGIHPTPETAWMFEGYRYVEAVDPIDGKRYRYTGRAEEPWQYDKHYLKGYVRFVLDKVLAPGEPPRYAITYDDISTHEEREYWIAGSSLRILDMQTNEVIAERIGYMMDPGQGSTRGGRSPWQYAAGFACPAFQPEAHFAAQRRQTQRFVLKVLVSVKGE